MLETNLTVSGIYPSYDSSVLINSHLPLAYLADKGFIKYYHCLEPSVTLRHIEQADIILLCRNVNALYQEIYQLASQLGIPMIYVLDDDIMGTPKGGLAYDYYNQPRRIKQYQWLLDHASLIRVHSPTLQKTIQNTTQTPT